MSEFKTWKQLDLLSPGMTGAVTRYEGRYLHTCPVSSEAMTWYGLPDLPPGFAYFGGIARAIALTELFGEQAPIRDTDIVRFPVLQNDQTLDVSEKQFIDKEEVLHAHKNALYEYKTRPEDLHTFFVFRDLTINELAVVKVAGEDSDGWQIIITNQCYEDLRDKVIRPSNKQLRPRYGYINFALGGQVSDRIALRAMLMHTVFEAQFGYAENAYEQYLPPTDFGEYQIDEYQMAIALYKALHYDEMFQNDGTLAEAFLERIFRYGYARQYEGMSPTEVATWLASRTRVKFWGSKIAPLILANINQLPEHPVPPAATTEFDRLANKATQFGGRGRFLVEGY